MADLTDTQKLLIVQRLATFHTPTEIKRELKDEHGVEASLQQIQFYDPGTAQGARELPDRWREIFAETRRAFLTEEESIAISHRAYRLRRLQRLIDDPVLSKNPQLVRDTLEQAAREVGGMYTNVRQFHGSINFAELSDEELDALVKGPGKG